MAQTPEGKVKAGVRKYLVSLGIRPAGGKLPPVEVTGWFYFPMQNGMGVSGIPDIVGCYKGKFFAIETKAPGKRNNTSANQKLRIAEIQAAGGAVLVADGVEDVRRYFEEVFGLRDQQT